MSTITDNIYKAAAEKGLYFDSVVGDLTVEQLFQLPLTTTSSRKACLNDIAIAIDREQKATQTSFVDDTSNVNKELQLKMELVKDVIATVQAKNKAKKDAKALQAQKARIRELILDKKDEALGAKSIEELVALEASL